MPDTRKVEIATLCRRVELPDSPADTVRALLKGDGGSDWLTPTEATEGGMRAVYTRRMDPELMYELSLEWNIEDAEETTLTLEVFLPVERYLRVGQVIIVTGAVVSGLAWGLGLGWTLPLFGASAIAWWGIARLVPTYLARRAVDKFASTLDFAGAGLRDSAVIEFEMR